MIFLLMNILNSYSTKLSINIFITPGPDYLMLYLIPMTVTKYQSMDPSLNHLESSVMFYLIKYVQTKVTKVLIGTFNCQSPRELQPAVCVKYVTIMINKL